MRRGLATTSRTRSTRGNGMESALTRGNSTMAGRVACRWEVAARGEVMQQPAGQEAWEAMAR
jgi:hypothetical protein